MTNFWTQLEEKKLTKEQIATYLQTKLGTTTNQLASNCLTEISRKINSYYQEEKKENYTIYSLIGSVSDISDITEKKFKDGKRKDQTYYILKIAGEKLQALQEDLPTEKWTQIKKLAIIGQNLVFKYKKWITNKQLLDFYPPDPT